MIAGRYEVGEVLGRGGMAEVRAGVDQRLQRPVAVKLLHPEMAARPDIRTRFEAEARQAARLSHPSAVAVYDTGEHEGVPYIVMERLPGETLADRIASGPVDPEWVRAVALDVLAALGAAHAAGIVHRDVKPGNILLTAEGSAKIGDFGIAKTTEAAGGDTMDVTATGQLLGTPAYLAPERIDGEEATPLSDIYGLGVVLYEALAGTRPFSGETALAVARAITDGRHRPLHEVRPDLDSGLADAVERAMARQPERRFPSAAEMAGALGGQPNVPVADATVAVGGDTAILTQGPAPVGAVDARRPSRRLGTLVFAGMIAVALVLLLALARGGDRRPTEPTVGGSTSPRFTSPVTTVAPGAGVTRTATTVAPTAAVTTAPGPSPAVPSGGGGKHHKGKGRD